MAAAEELVQHPSGPLGVAPTLEILDGGLLLPQNALASLVVLRETFSDDGNRVTTTGLLPVDDYSHVVRVTSSDRSQLSNGVIGRLNLMLPGWTQYIDGKGAATNLHDAVAQKTPDAITLSIATDGVNKHGDPLPTSKALDRSFETMADARLKIAHLFAEGREVDIFGTSMGTILAYLMAMQNMRTPEEQRLNIRRLNLISPGLLATEVAEHERFRDPLDNTVGKITTALSFFGHMAVDGGREAIRHPNEAADTLIGGLDFLGVLARDPRKALAIAGNFAEMLPGTPYELIKEVTGAHDVRVVAGDKDTVRETAQYKALKKLHPQRIVHTEVPGRGHALSIHPHSPLAHLGF